MAVKRLFLLLFVCALIVPRVAWGAHVSGHESVATSSTHLHPSDLSHEGAGGREDAEGDSDAGDGLTHNHAPAEVLSLMAGTDVAKQDARVPHSAAVHLLDIRSRGAPSATFGSLLRPPRTT